jgi:hypothetical protein
MPVGEPSTQAAPAAVRCRIAALRTIQLHTIGAEVGCACRLCQRSPTKIGFVSQFAIERQSQITVPGAKCSVRGKSDSLSGLTLFLVPLS